jgi:uncharacterized membrane protein YccF (DUF307 family)
LAASFAFRNAFIAVGIRITSSASCLESAGVLIPFGSTMDRRYTLKEKARITAGAVSALVIVGWMIALSIALLSAR